MNADVSSPFAYVQSIFMLVLILMLFVGVAGGKPETVLQPLMGIIGTLISTLLTTGLALVAAILRGILSILLSGLHALLSYWKSSNSRHINH
jgi:hypothetical protein